ncbi:MAG TPA: acetate/propionate family kinase [Terriglobia bacterium]|nr:acetate/propionate family kinase [Terriglobia bacterium]
MASVLTINGGSSSIKFALYGRDEPPERWLHGTVDRIGQLGASLTFHDVARNRKGCCSMEASEHQSAADRLIDWFEEHLSFASVSAVGHRVVHGMKYTQPVRITQELLDELHRIIPYDPDHLPREIQLIEAFRQRHPELPQVACFDTAFHSTMPRVARLLPIPRRFDALGIQRYGFHGLSYAYLMEELARVAGAKAAQGRVILAHLGNGASLAAVRDGKSIDTSMGFTPASGLPMGSRPGDLDPGVAWYLMLAGPLTPKQFNHLINHESGLLGVSETSSDMRDLVHCQASDIRAAEAVELFCYQTRKWIGAFAAVLGGLETLVFSGGIGENNGEVRARICSELQFLGIDLDETRNALSDPVISAEASHVSVRVIPTDEEQMIARHVCRVLGRDDELIKESNNG